MQSVIALVGRPNVGKSTLFNRLTKRRDALVANLPGLTRDRQYGVGRFGDFSFIAIDTGGITGYEEGIDAAMAAQSLLAIDEATLCLFIVDAKTGLAPDDSRILNHLRKTDKPYLLVVNKVDGMDVDQASAEFYGLGVRQLFPITATQGRGVKQLLQACLAHAQQSAEEQVDATDPTDTTEATNESDATEVTDTGNANKSTDTTNTTEAVDAVGIKGIKIAISGRPNVGKSTLVNRMLGEERVVVYDQPGTTRDSVYIPFERRGQLYTLIDTAGIRKRGRTRETVEKFSVVKALQAIKDAHVVVLLVDAREGIVEQDLHLIGYVLETGRGLVIALNKWDGMDAADKDRVKREIRRRFTFVDFAKIHFISALHGTGVGDLYQSIERAYQSAHKLLETSVLNGILEEAVHKHAPPVVGGRRIKLRYAHAGGKNPPTIVIHGKQTGKVPGHYARYLEKTFRSALNMEGTPIRIELKSDENPYVRNEKNLSPRQVAQKRRMAKNRKAQRGN